MAGVWQKSVVEKQKSAKIKLNTEGVFFEYGVNISFCFLEFGENDIS
jgi:hypothetical protein